MILKKLLIIYVSLILCGCVSSIKVDKLDPKIIKFNGDLHQKKHIFVFFDGTGNTEASKTNIYRLYKKVKAKNDVQTTAIYIHGVGTLDKKPLTGNALGRGMEDRIKRAYAFLNKNYRANDNIYIFGFSRGALQARELAGLISYVGLPKDAYGLSEKKLVKNANKILRRLREVNDLDGEVKTYWNGWKPLKPPPHFIAEQLNDVYKDMQPVRINFLGLWDTVPGSSFKKYDNEDEENICLEKIGIFKKYFHWLPYIISKGHRYKTNSYPTIEFIAHALSIDEKRSKFAPLLVCDAINKAHTKVYQRAFPGAHADVGGGYIDSNGESVNGLPLISLKWMIGLFNLRDDKIPFKLKLDENSEIPRANGVAHWSIGDSPANTGSKYLDRNLKTNYGIEYDESFYDRVEAPPVAVCAFRKIKLLSYPISREEIKKPNTILFKLPFSGKTDNNCKQYNVLP